MRKRLGLSQSQFADRFGLSIRTVQQWEQGRAEPDQPARVLLALINYAPDDMHELINGVFSALRAHRLNQEATKTIVGFELLARQLENQKIYPGSQVTIKSRPKALVSEPNSDRDYAVAS